MIQPAYGPYIHRESNYVSPEYGISSALFSGANIALSSIGLIHLDDPSRNSAVPVLGLISGTTQLTMGIVGYANAEASGQSAFYGTEVTNKFPKIH